MHVLTTRLIAISCGRPQRKYPASSPLPTSITCAFANPLSGDFKASHVQHHTALRAIQAHDRWIEKLAYLPDGQRITTGSGDGTAKVWNVESGAQEGILMVHDGMVVDLAVTRDGKRIISSLKWGDIKVWGVESHKLAKEWTYRNGQKFCQPESRGLDDPHWDPIHNCWATVEEQPDMETIIPTIEQFLGHCPASLN